MKFIAYLKSITLLFCILGSFLFLFQCSNERLDFTSISNLDDQVSLRQNTIVLVDPSNSNNPIDSVGQIHNQVLDLIAFGPGFDTIDILETVYDYAELNWDELSSYVSIYSADTLCQSIWNFSNNDDLDGLLNYISNLAGFSISLHGQIEDVLSVLDYNDEDVSASAIIDSIKIKEQNFAASTVIYTIEEQRIFYGFSSVLRHSIAYWFTVSQDDTHPYYPIINEMISSYDEFGENSAVVRAPFPWRKLWRGLSILGADAAGYVGGFYLGTGLSMNPIVGGGCGIFIGGVCSGIARDLWDNP